MKKSVSRRELVRLLGGVAGAGAAGVLLARAGQHPQTTSTARGMRNVPWPYKPLDPEAAGQRGFEGYYKHHCMYGAFEAVVAPVAQELGSPYTEFPFDMFTYGAGGINGWATTCGAINGGAAAIQLLSPNPNPLIDALFSWYESASLPDVHPKGAKYPQVRSVGSTPLCHESIVKWCKASGKKAYSPERSERCGAITASTARKVVMLLNEQAAGKPIATVLPKETQQCMSCHEKGGAVENMRTKMNCGGCHAPLMGKHPVSKT